MSLLQIVVWYDSINFVTLLQDALDAWVAIPGTIPKALAFINLLNTTQIADAVLAAAGQAAENEAIAQVAESLPENITSLLTGLVYAMDVGQAGPAIQQILLTVS